MPPTVLFMKSKVESKWLNFSLEVHTTTGSRHGDTTVSVTTTGTEKNPTKSATKKEANLRSVTNASHAYKNQYRQPLHKTRSKKSGSLQ